jgi:RimJ/RimL family protein N-acetyltransferase
MVLRGKLISLRNITRRDATAIYELAKSRDISRYTFIPFPYQLEDALYFIRYSQQRQRQGTEFNLGIQLNETGQIIGMIGLMKISYPHRRGEIGYWVGRPYWGKGIAVEAVRLMVKWAFQELGLRRISAGVMHPNQSSVRVLEKVGFVREGCYRKHIFRNNRWYDEYRFGLLRSEFLPK